jgi:hypothetical protein
VDAQRAVEFGDEFGGQLSEPFADPLNGHGVDLLGLIVGALAGNIDDRI